MLLFHLDYETSESVGHGGFQVISIIDDDKDEDITDKINQGKHYLSIQQVIRDLGLDPEVTDYEIE